MPQDGGTAPPGQESHEAFEFINTISFSLFLSLPVPPVPFKTGFYI